MTKVVGITGGIGSGKSTLCGHLKKNGFLVHESDKVVSNMYNNPNKTFIEFIKKTNIEDIIKNGNINKKLITKIIFDNPKLRNVFEKYIHKETELQRQNFIKKNLDTKKKAIFIDIPLLLENKLEKQFDLVVCVVSTRKKRTKRILKNKKFSKEVLKKIFKIQTTDKERRARSHIIIKNNKSKKDFIYSVQQTLTKVLK